MFSCEVCTYCSCCVESEAYMLDPYIATASDGKTKESEDFQQISLGIGLVLGAPFFVIVGFIILFKLRGSLTMHRSYAGQINKEACQDILRIEKQKRPLPIPSMQEDVHRSTKRSNIRNIHRKSKSLHQIFGHNQDIRIPVRKTLSLQTLIQLSQTIGRRARWDKSVVSMYSDKQNSYFSMEDDANSMELEEINFKGLTDRGVSPVELFTNSEFPSQNISQCGSLNQDLQEDLYNTIDEAVLSIYDYAYKH
ncbi:hypothetical protein CHS0354_013889 [Potamilus streckersoni]|uniref:Uncharacterized protein n=1 Tax=Potamilus streckersoni TaxID=2493646 RepID=A0AAE0VKU7_9BIVA|nr:hypothetical protein CHS0354_013889 [Potamilus streckersoni]